MKNVIVLGVSNSGIRVANTAVNRLIENNFHVIAIGKSESVWNGIKIQTDWPTSNQSVYAILIYISPEHQNGLLEKIISYNPQKVIFNPGTENPKLASELNHHNITTEFACTLVLLSLNQF